MAMGKRREKQRPLWIGTEKLAQSPGHPFYEQLSKLLREEGFDPFIEELCRTFYSEPKGRPSMPPTVYFRMVLIGYFEGIESDRGIAWRVADSITLREFLGYELSEATPDHSTLSRTRRLIDIETHEAAFDWVIKLLARKGLIRGKTLGIDGTTLEANAAMRKLVRRDTAEDYAEYVERLAKEAGIENPTKEDAARFDRKRKKKTSNKEWKHPHDPDAKVAKMKDGRTRMAHKAEHAVDLETEAILAVTVQPADRGDTTSLGVTLEEVGQVLESVLEDPEAASKMSHQLMTELVADKGYHSNAVLKAQSEAGIRTYISEPKHGRRRWKGKAQEKAAVYGNRRRNRGRRGRQLSRDRSEKVERTFAHCYETGGIRRTTLRGHRNILKRQLIHVAAFNLSLVLRQLIGLGTPRGLQGLRLALFGPLWALYRFLRRLLGFLVSPMRHPRAWGYGGWLHEGAVV